MKTSSRIDPVAIQKDAGPLYRRADGGYTVDPALAVDELKEGTPTGKKLLFKPNTKGVDVFHDPKEAAYPDQGRPSEANHGNVTPDIDYRRDQNRNKIKDEEGKFIPVGGVTITAAEQTVVLSFPALRRLRFPLDKIPERQDATRRGCRSPDSPSRAGAVRSGSRCRGRPRLAVTVPPLADFGFDLGATGQTGTQGCRADPGGR